MKVKSWSLAQSLAQSLSARRTDRYGRSPHPLAPGWSAGSRTGAGAVAPTADSVVLVITIELPVRRPVEEFQREVLGRLPEFWDGRDVQHLHHPVWFRQFGSGAQAARGKDGALCAYLLACVTSEVAYVHVVATLPEARGTSLARRMYENVFHAASQAGCPAVEAATTLENTGSIAFHERLGFRASLVPDYAGPGQDRVHFVRRTPTIS